MKTRPWSRCPSMRCPLPHQPSPGSLTFTCCSRALMCHHAWHVHRCSCAGTSGRRPFPPGKRASLSNKAERVFHRVHTDMPSVYTTDGSMELYPTSKVSLANLQSGEYIVNPIAIKKKKLSLGTFTPMKPAAMLRAALWRGAGEPGTEGPLGCSQRGSEAFLPSLALR